jgi:hypothetical protein
MTASDGLDSIGEVEAEACAELPSTMSDRKRAKRKSLPFAPKGQRQDPHPHINSADPTYILYRSKLFPVS